MPIYEYTCETCGIKVEKVRLQHCRDGKISCGCGGNLRRCPSAPARIIGDTPIYHAGK